MKQKETDKNTPFKELKPLQPTESVISSDKKDYESSYGGAINTTLTQVNTSDKNKQVIHEVETTETLQKIEKEVFIYPSADGQLQLRYGSNLTTGDISEMGNLKGQSRTMVTFLYGNCLARYNDQKKVEKAKSFMDINFKFELNIIDLMDTFGKSDRKEFRKNLNETFTQLLNTQLSTLPYEHGEFIYQEKYKTYNVLSTVDSTNRGYTITLNPDLAFLIAKQSGGIFPLDNVYYRIAENKQLAKALAYKLNSHYTMQNNQRSGTHDRIRVKTLLDTISPNILPTYDEVMQGNGAVNNRIIERFTDALDLIQEKSENNFSWEFCNPNKKPLTDYQLNNMNYDIFIDLLVAFEFKDLPLGKDKESQAEK